MELIKFSFRIALYEQEKKKQNAISNAASGLWGMLKSVATTSNASVESILFLDFRFFSVYSRISKIAS